MFGRFIRSRNGSIINSFAFLMPVVFGASLFAVDYATVASQRAGLQDAADAAALGATRQLSLGHGETDAIITDQYLREVAHSIAKESLGVETDRLSTALIQTDDSRIQVKLDLTVETSLNLVKKFGAATIHADATAELFGTRNICIIALQEKERFNGIELSDSARILGGECGVYANSTASEAITAKVSALIDAPYICSGGGFGGAKSNFDGTMVGDCKAIDDPLSARVLPSPPACTHEERVVIDGSGAGANASTNQIWPGNYCGGLTIKGGANVEMQPGTYFIGTKGVGGLLNSLSGGLASAFDKAVSGDNGDPDNEACNDPSLKETCGALVVMDDSSLTGEYVSIFTQGPFDHIAFIDEAFVNLSASKKGDLAGILLVSKPVCPPVNTRCHPRKLLITSDSVKALLGTIYMPQDNILIDTDSSISEEADFTIVVARQLFARNTPTLVLNTDYANTDVPVPTGLTASKGVRLSR